MGLRVRMDVCLLWALCVVRWRFLRRTDHTSRGVSPSAVCLSVIVKPPQLGELGSLGGLLRLGKK